MAGELRIRKDLWDAYSELVGREPDRPCLELVLAAYFDALTFGYGLSSSVKLSDYQTERAAIPQEAHDIAAHALGLVASAYADEQVGNRLYELVVAVSKDLEARRILNRRSPLSEVGLRKVGQIAWNLEQTSERRLLPIAPSAANDGTPYRSIPIERSSGDYATLEWSARTNTGVAGLGDGVAATSRGASLRKKIAKLVTLIAQSAAKQAPDDTRVALEQSGTKLELLDGRAPYARLTWPTAASANSPEPRASSTESGLLGFRSQEVRTQLRVEATALGADSLAWLERWFGAAKALNAASKWAEHYLSDPAGSIQAHATTSDSLRDDPNWPPVQSADTSTPDELTGALEALEFNLRFQIDAAQIILNHPNDWDAPTTLVAHGLEYTNSLRVLTIQRALRKAVVAVGRRGVAAAEQEAGTSRLRRTESDVSSGEMTLDFAMRIFARLKELDDLKARCAELVDAARALVRDAAISGELSRSTALLGDGSVIGALALTFELSIPYEDDHDSLDASRRFADMLLTSPLIAPEERKMWRYKALKEYERELRDAGRVAEAERVLGRIEELESHEPLLALEYAEEMGT